ncbi:hypothetical protein H4R33_003732 [Dimargaris cristalligena]|uniref:Carbohydrate-binding module family 19 domain-containing protein n=1 Tax=Dimargaris cristalligena TaxID=215637 RepID=A0A4P9ZJP2_9FUNG|nr:hypothetical protein H4R33_003732 [Dimargaris cristalligena]RKP33293.1 hypothetical protein BJ085DRAFT_34201 [Dimargaris cristalligena]|eukprot:RKP33293.1 hypothetical protein BJ085DRAFT_34201 [Dimargaris cristalligena]
MKLSTTAATVFVFGLACLQALAAPQDDSSAKIKGKDEQAPKSDSVPDAIAAAKTVPDQFYSSYFSTCVSGTMRCDRWNRSIFYVCDNSYPVRFSCGPGTACKQNGDYIYCGWP